MFELFGVYLKHTIFKHVRVAYCNIIMVNKLVNTYTKLQEPVTVQYVFLWASGAPNSRAAPGSPHSSYATDYCFLTSNTSLFNAFIQPTTE